MASVLGASQDQQKSTVHAKNTFISGPRWGDLLGVTKALRSRNLMDRIFEDGIGLASKTAKSNNPPLQLGIKKGGKARRVNDKRKGNEIPIRREQNNAISREIRIFLAKDRDV